jgi:hypothetical protein
MVMMVTDTDTYKGKSAAKIFASSFQRKSYLLAVTAVASFALLNIVTPLQHNSAATGAGVQQLQTLTGQEKNCLPILGAAQAQDLMFMRAPTNDRECLIDQGESPYIDILSKVLVGTPLGGSGSDVQNLQPYDEVVRSLGDDYSAFSYTMVGKARLHNIRCAIDEVNRNGIQGSIVELGVWRGGVMMLASAMGKQLGIQRDIYLLDAFQVVGAYTNGGLKRNEDLANFLATNVDDVRQSFEYFDLGGPHVHYEKGLFKDTLPLWKDVDVPIAILRVDGNFYDSYQDAMYFLYEKVPVGGIIIFDDVFSNGSVMRCWWDFKNEQGLPENLNRIDRHSAWFRKEKAVKLNWDYFRAPQDVNKP